MQSAMTKGKERKTQNKNNIESTRPGNHKERKEKDGGGGGKTF